MANGHSNGSGESRLDRMESLMQLLIDDHLKFADEHQKLLTAQVVLTERVDKLAAGVTELLGAQKHTDERLNALVHVVDEWIRNRPQQ